MMLGKKIRCGDTVKDTLSGLEGVVVARTEWLHGCVRLAVSPPGSKDGKPYEPFWVDEPQAEVVKIPRKVAKRAPSSPRAGPRDAPARTADPKGPRPSEQEMW